MLIQAIPIVPCGAAWPPSRSVQMKPLKIKLMLYDKLPNYQRASGPGRIQSRHANTLTSRKRVDLLQDGSLMILSLYHDSLQVNTGEFVFKMGFILFAMRRPWKTIIVILKTNTILGDLTDITTETKTLVITRYILSTSVSQLIQNETASTFCQSFQEVFIQSQGV